MGYELDTTGKACMVVGAAGSGKTRYLVKRACELAADDAGDVLVLCATPLAADEFAARLAAAGARGVRVTTPRELSLSMLASERARAFTGRRPRMLLPFEEDFLFEDLRTLGLKQRRATEMLRFMKRNFSEAADDADWVISTEEQVVLDLLRACLETAGGMLECEIAAFAVRWLAADPHAARETRVAHVLADDYQRMSRASQLLANALARTSMTVALDPLASSEVFDTFPYARGREEFARANPHMRLVQLDCRSANGTARRAAALVAACEGAGPEGAAGEDADDGCAADENGTFEERACASPGDEAREIAACVREALEAGIGPHEICVTCGSRRWAHELERMLARLDVETATVMHADMLRGDVRDAVRSRRSRAFSLLALAADPSDCLAWRSVCGFGDSLAHSYEFSVLRTYAREHRMPLADVLHAACADTLPEALPSDCGKVLRTAAQVLQALKACAGLRGEELLYAVARVAAGPDAAAEVAGALARLAGPVSCDDDAGTLFGRALGRCVAARPVHGERVRLLFANDCAGTTAQVMVFSGLVNGFTPPRTYFDRSALVEEERQDLWRAGAQLVYAAAGGARGRFIATRFTRISPEGAERYELEVERVRFEQGKRVCVAAESAYLAHLRPHVEEDRHVEP